jgi:hypothetical protein
MMGIERLHYFDGQRLVARDLELEQKYHMRVRRLLNHGLYSAGVVDGLQVSNVDPRHVRVSAGLALDPRGREIILLSDTTMTVPSRLPASSVLGYFLVISYGEEKEPGTLADCREGVGTTPPSRIKEFPTLSWTETWPNQQYCGEKGHASDCAVVLALVTLTPACDVKKIEPGVRQYAHSQVPGQVHPFALEGEKDIDSANSKVLHFQIRGGPPDAVLLYLWGDAISSLLYTEVGNHTHSFALNSTPTSDETAPIKINHTHPIDGMLSDGPNVSLVHHHSIHHIADVTYPLLTNDSGVVTGSGISNSFDAEKNKFGTLFITDADLGHQHNIAAHDTRDSSLGTAPAHNHTLTASSTTGDAGNIPSATGSTPYQARGGPAYDYPQDLQVWLDGNDITGWVKATLGWSTLGDGTSSHALVSSGTGALDLTHSGHPLEVGPHKIELLLGKGGGKVLYNLYVE